ncbi:Uncharacterized protein TCM_026598 [Theobroma cacao]|uniref:Uncharacterized protein n=1 Tax=Theobroma cacao TaxID=3641 RepID=A0A061F2X8_THECC|nr:Uncharacterized protein TCM_026598 [Theobroma cacao]
MLTKLAGIKKWSSKPNPHGAHFLQTLAMTNHGSLGKWPPLFLMSLTDSLRNAAYMHAFDHQLSLSLTPKP